MRRGLFAVLLLAGLVGVNGCAAWYPGSPISSVGWSFQIGRPSTLANISPTILSQTAGPIGVQPLGSLTGVSNAPVVAPIGSIPALSTTGKEFSPMPKTAPPMQPPCTMEDVCRMLEEMLRRLPSKQEE